MAWFKMDDGFANSKPVLRIPRRYRLQAVGLWALAGTWSAKEETDGFIPEYVLEELCGTPGVANQLVQAGLWEIVPGSSANPTDILQASSSNSQLPGWVYRNWSKYQPTKAELEENREKERIRKANYRKSQRDSHGTDSGQTEGHHPESEHPDPTRPDPTLIKELSSEISDEIPRPDIDNLLDLLDTCLEQNGFKKPSRTKKNADAARLLLDKDGYKVEQVAWMIRWATNHEFWRSNIMSMSKLREKFDQLKAQAGVGAKAPAAGFNGEIDVDAILGRDVWTPPAPPAGLTVAEEIDWKKQQRAAHQAERLEEAKKKLGVAA
jgi:hypothetical protein